MRSLRRFLCRGQNLLALVVVGFYVVVAVAAPRLAPPDDPEDPTPFRIVGRITDHTPHPPSQEALLGTLPNQLDIYYTLVWGTRSALRFGLIVALTTACFGVLIGATSGYFGGRINGVVMRITDAFLTFPTIAGVWLVKQLIFPTRPDIPLTSLQRALLNLKVDPVMLTLILFSWMPYARLINANIAHLKQAQYVLAARSLGTRNTRIILRHLLPNAIAPAIVLAGRDIGGKSLFKDFYDQCAILFPFLHLHNCAPHDAFMP